MAITEGQVVFTPVDPKYTPYLKLFPTLSKLKIVGCKRHQFSHALSMISPSVMAGLIQPHWIPLAVVSMYSEYLEIIPYSVAKKEDDERSTNRLSS